MKLKNFLYENEENKKVVKMYLDNKEIEIDATRPISYFSNNAVKDGYLAKPIVVFTGQNKINLNKGSFISFYENYGLKECNFKPQKLKTHYGELEFKSIVFYEHGLMKKGKLTKNQTVETPIGNLKFDGEITIYFYWYNVLGTIYFKGTKTVPLPNGEKRQFKNKIAFYQDGHLKP